MIKCSDNTYYTGITNDVQRRFIEHQSGENESPYTFKRRPLQLVYYSEFSDVNNAIAKEKQIKKWSRKKKEALIKENYEQLTLLSKKNWNK